MTINLPSIYIDAIAKLTEQGLFPSRSEAIRVALRDFLKCELGMVEGLLDFKENEGKVTVSQVVKARAMDVLDPKALAKGQEKTLAPGAIALARGPTQPAPKPVKKPIDMRSNQAGWGDKRDLSDAKIAGIKHHLGMR